MLPPISWTVRHRTQASGLVWLVWLAKLARPRVPRLGLQPELPVCGRWLLPGKPRQVSRAETADLRSRDAKPAGPQARQYSATGNLAGQRSDHGRRLADCRRGASREGHGRRSRWSLPPAGQVRHRRRIRRGGGVRLDRGGASRRGNLGGAPSQAGRASARSGRSCWTTWACGAMSPSWTRAASGTPAGGTGAARDGAAATRLTPRRPQGYCSGRSLGRARGRGLPGATVRARIPRVARSALSGITGKMAASFQLCSAADQS